MAAINVNSVGLLAASAVIVGAPYFAGPINESQLITGCGQRGVVEIADNTDNWGVGFSTISSTSEDQFTSSAQQDSSDRLRSDGSLWDEAEAEEWVREILELTDQYIGRSGADGNASYEAARPYLARYLGSPVYDSAIVEIDDEDDELSLILDGERYKSAFYFHPSEGLQATMWDKELEVLSTVLVEDLTARHELDAAIWEMLGA